MRYMLRFLWNATRGHRLTPWRSPYLLWRVETYCGVKMQQIGFLEFWEFMWRERSNLWRFLKWTAEIERYVHPGPKARNPRPRRPGRPRPGGRAKLAWQFAHDKRPAELRSAGRTRACPDEVEGVRPYVCLDGVLVSAAGGDCALPVRPDTSLPLPAPIILAADPRLAAISR